MDASNRDGQDLCPEVPSGEYGQVFENYFLAGAVRWAKKYELANCPLTLNPENTQECVLISTRKNQRGHEWKLDRNYGESSP
jgi:hypothetical protein